MIVVGLPLWVAQTNCWIVSADERECIVIDVPPDPRAVMAEIKSKNLKVVAVLATHGHIDHVGGISSFVAEELKDPSIPVHIHASDQRMLEDPIGHGSGLAQYLIESGLQTTPPEHILGLSDGEIIKGAGMTLRVLHTPGHTKGSTCLLLGVQGETEMLFSGDHLFKDSIGRTDLPGGSLEELMESMRTKILPLNDQVPVLPGHGPSTTIGQERIANPFLQGLR